jgi:hypothetical protein
VHEVDIDLGQVLMNLEIIGATFERCRFVALKPDDWIAAAREISSALY